MTRRLWINGVPCTAGAAAVDPASPLGAWGEGFFETARVYSGTILALPQHVARMQRSLEAYYKDGFDQRMFRQVWSVAQQSADHAQNARLRIVATPTSPSACELRYITTMSDWSPPDESEYRGGVRIDFTELPHPRLGSLGKSTSYHWARLGRHEARRRSIDDVVFFSGETVIETTTASILCFDGTGWSTPDANSGCLDSTTLRAFAAQGLNVRRTSVTRDQLEDARAIALVSSLRLAVGVSRLGNRDFTEPDKHVRPLRELLLKSSEAPQ